MPTKCFWHIPNRIVYIHLSGEITFDDIRATLRETNALYKVGTAPVYALFDASDIQRVPTNITDYRKVFTVELHSNLKYIITFGIRNPFLSFLTSIFAQTVRREFRITRTKADALALIEKLEGKPFSAPTKPSAPIAPTK